MSKYALLIGINNYQGVSDLKGCINDVKNIKDILISYFGFSEDRITILTDKKATKENIISGLTSLVNKSEMGDQLVFHFSGHGSQIRDKDNDELKDHLDELICPYDMNWDAGFITDDMLRNILNELNEGVEMEIMLDCCHSGTGTREIIESIQREEGKDYRRLERYLDPPQDVKGRLPGPDEITIITRTFRTDRDISLNHVLWTGCLDFQTSEDAFIEGTFNGAFTYYFCNHIRANSGIILRQDLHIRIQESLKLYNYNQNPQLECSSARKIMNVFGGVMS